MRMSLRMYMFERVRVHSHWIFRFFELNKWAIVYYRHVSIECQKVCSCKSTPAGIFAIRSERDYVLEEDFLKAARKVAECKKLESKLDYSKV